jgi:tRNA threonylcarbamoyl adenosine modification protein YjeE
MRTCSLSIAAEAEVAPLARALAAALPDRAFVALAGDLGAGKTTFVKAFAAAVGIDPAEVVSPTFGLVHEHPSSAGILLHADMYRLGGTDDLHEVGWPDAVARARWVFVEWPERIAAALPADRLDVTIAIDAPAARTFTVTGHGPAHEAVIDHLLGPSVP